MFLFCLDQPRSRLMKYPILFKRIHKRVSFLIPSLDRHSIKQDCFEIDLFLLIDKIETVLFGYLLDERRT